MQIKQIAIIALLATISGCALWGPSYKSPDVNTPESWVSQDNLSKVDKSNESMDITLLANMKWWEQFKDPALNGLVESALANNMNIQMAIGNIVQAQGQLQQVEMAWIPTVSLSPGYKATGTYTGAANNAVSNYTVGGNAGYFVDFTPSYTLNIMQQLRQQEAAKANLEATKYAKDAMRLTILGQTTGGYLSLRGYDYILNLQQQLVDDTAKQYELGKSQYKEGYISLLTLQNYQQQYEAAKAQVPITQNNIVKTRNALRVLTNNNPGDVERGISFAEIPMDGLIPVNLPSTVLRSRPDIRQSESQLVMANANIGVATSSFFPTISLTGNTGFAANGLSNLFNAGSDFWQSQIAATMPILNMAIYGQIKQARGAYYTAYWNYINSVRTSFAQVDNGLSSHEKLTNSYKDQEQSYQATVTAFNLGNGRFKEGADSYVQVLNYKISMDNSAITLAQLKVQQLQTIVTLYQSLAAGYDINNTNKPSTKFGDGRDI